MNASELERLERRTARWARACGLVVAAVGGATVLVGVLSPGWVAVLALASGLFAFNMGLQIMLEADDDEG
jgi:hypothetical protein